MLFGSFPTLPPTIGSIGSTPKPTADARDETGARLSRVGTLRPVEFRGIPFYATDTNTDFGRRAVVHEYPQDDVPFVEDMGRRARRFNIAGFIAGSDWEANRDALIAACESPGLGLLSHPDYGDFYVVCEGINVAGNLIDQWGRVDLQLQFVESGTNRQFNGSFNKAIGNNRFPTIFVDPLLALRNAIEQAYNLLVDAYATAYILAHLPAWIKSYVSTLLGTSSGPLRNKNSNEIQTALKKFDGTAITDTDNLGASITALVQATTAGLVEDNVVERSGRLTARAPLPGANSRVITPYQALVLVEAVAAAPAPVVVGDTQAKRKLRRAMGAVDFLFKASAYLEACRAATYIEYQSAAEAQVLATRIRALHSIALEAADEFDEARWALVEVGVLYEKDLLERTPVKARLWHKEFRQPVPALALAYEIYEDLDREAEIIARNHITNPSFCAGTLELRK